MDIQRLRNYTTGRLHTAVEHLYQDAEFLVGDTGFFTHMLPRIFQAMQPWLKERVTDSRFWDDAYDTTHTGEFEIQPMTKEEQDVFWKRYAALPNPLIRD